MVFLSITFSQVKKYSHECEFAHMRYVRLASCPSQRSPLRSTERPHHTNHVTALTDVCCKALHI